MRRYGTFGIIVLVIGALLVGAIGPTIDRDDGGLAYLVAAVVALVVRGTSGAQGSASSR